MSTRTTRASKRKHATAAAASATPEKKRPSPPNPAVAMAEAAEAAGSSSTSRVPAPLAADARLQRLPTVLLHLCMQLLDLRSLMLISSTSRQLASEALHPQAGRFLASTADLLDASDNDPLRRMNHPAHASPVSRMHSGVVMAPEGPPSSFEGKENAEALAPREQIRRAAKFGSIRKLGLTFQDSPPWTERDALELLEHPCMRTVEGVFQLGYGAGGLWLSDPRVQEAICSLPRLRHLGLNFVEEGVALLFSTLALKRAVGLTSLEVTSAKGGIEELAFLAAAPPTLTRLKFAVLNETVVLNDSAEPPAGRWSAMARTLSSPLSRITHLHLEGYDVSQLWEPRAELQAFFRATHALRTLQLSIIDTNEILRGCMSAGAEALGSLRTLRCGHGSMEHLDPRLLQRFLGRFPLVDVRLNLCRFEQAQTVRDIHVNFGGWAPRVTIQQFNQGPMNVDQARTDDDESEEDNE